MDIIVERVSASLIDTECMNQITRASGCSDMHCGYDVLRHELGQEKKT